MNQNPFEAARQKAELTEGSQEKNRLWWESLPMTYAEWDKEDRRPKTKEEFEVLASKFLEANPWLKNNFDFSAFAGKHILEIGCGTGVASCLFARAGAKVTSIDITENAVTLARNNARLLGTYVDAIQMDAEKMTFPDGTFDFVFSWGVLHHTNNPSAAYRHVCRVLKPGGDGLIMVYNKNSLRYYLKGLAWLFLKGKIFAGENLETVQKFFTDGYYHKHYRPSELKVYLKLAGLTSHEIAFSHMSKKMIPGVPLAVDNFLKNRFGWFIIVRVCREP